MSPDVCNNSIPPPVSSPDTPVPFKHMKKSSILSPATLKRNTDICKQTGKRPKAKLMGRFTRSMAKGNVVKSPMNDGVHVETIVIDDEEGDSVLPVDDHNVGHEFVSNPADDGSPAFDKDVLVEPVVDPPAKGKSVETSLPGFHHVGDMLHLLFVNCLLDKIRKME